MKFKIDGEKLSDASLRDSATKTEINLLKQENKQLKEIIEETETKLGLLAQLENNYPANKEIKKTKGVKSSEAVSHIVLSDVHLEERVEPSTVNYRNEYNPDIAKDSVYETIKNGVRLHHIMKKDIPINKMVFGILGDIINGYIHEEFVEDNYMSPTEALLQAEELIDSSIQHILKNTEVDLTVLCKYGNHGRTTQRPKYATAYKNSYEWLMYKHLQNHYKDNERVNFIVENGYLTYLNYFDKYDVRWHHGEAIRYQGGIGGIAVSANKAIQNWDEERKAILDVFAHHHQQNLGYGKFISNGSVIGWNAYAIGIKARYEKPQQTFFLADSHRGITVRCPILVR